MSRIAERRLGVVVVVLVLALISWHHEVQGQVPPYLQAKSALVLVEVPAGTGSGFAVSPSLVATACHVVKGAAAIKLHFWVGKAEVAARQQVCNEHEDIAFITTTVPPEATTLQFAPSMPSQGDQIWVWGYPLGTTIALEPSVTVGIVSATETPQGFLALNVSGAPGNSGGPVVNSQGQVVGIFVGSWLAGGERETGFKYAAPGTAAAKLQPGSVQSIGPSPVLSAGSVVVRAGESIGVVKLGMTPAQVQEAIGLPPSEVNRDWHSWTARKLEVRFDNGKAILIDTEDPAASTPEGIHIGSSDTDLIKTYGRPMCSSVRDYRGKTYLAWYYDGLFFFLDKTPRQVFAIRVLPGGLAASVCR